MPFPIRLTSEPSRTPGVTWVRLALDTFDDRAETLDTVVSNFTSAIAITDPEHARVAVDGQPARGWCTFLSVRDGLDGPELWGHVYWLDDEPAVACSAGSLWARVHIEPNAVHPITGRRIGAKLQTIELTAPPSLANQPRASLARKEPHPMTPETKLILADLHRFEADAPNRGAAVERCALEHVPGAKTMPRHVLFERYVHPALAELGRQSIRAASNAGRLKLAPASLSANGRLQQQSRPQPGRPKLDVSNEPGRNTFEKLLVRVKRTQPLLSHDAAFRVACDTKG